MSAETPVIIRAMDLIQDTNLLTCVPLEESRGAGWPFFIDGNMMERGTVPAGRGQPVFSNPHDITKRSKGSGFTVTLSLGDSIHVTGEASEIALYTFVLLQINKVQREKEDEKQAKIDAAFFEALENLTFDDFRKREMGEEDE